MVGNDPHVSNNTTSYFPGTNTYGRTYITFGQASSERTTIESVRLEHSPTQVTLPTTKLAPGYKERARQGWNSLQENAN